MDNMNPPFRSMLIVDHLSNLLVYVLKRTDGTLKEPGIG
jgi:hypothetical protein